MAQLQFLLHNNQSVGTATIWSTEVDELLLDLNRLSATLSSIPRREHHHKLFQKGTFTLGLAEGPGGHRAVPCQ